VLHDGTYANLESIEDVFSIGLNRAVSVIAEKQLKGKGGRNGGTAAALKELGDHPDGGGKIVVRDGKYGPYVNFGKVNATLPKGKGSAVGDGRGCAGADCREGSQGRRRQEAVPQGGSGQGAAAKKTTAKKAAAKKPAAKKKG
jgi:DNA topoisomerase-1